MYAIWRCCTVILILWTWTLIEGTESQRVCPLQETILPCRCLVRGEEYQIWCSHSDLPKVLEGLRTVSEYIKDPIDELIIENNFLPSLPGRTFFPLKILRLMLRHNGLERVSSDWLAGMKSTLVEIFIVEPQLRSLPDDSLSQLNTLQAVTIQTDLLKRLPNFSGLPKLRYLQIESKSLQEISPTNFKDNPSLEKLHITSSPQLTLLEANSFFDLPSLTLLNISNCGLTWIHPRAIRELPLLKELWLVGNQISDAGMVGRASRELPQLEMIRLDNNFIEVLAEAAFVDLPSVKKIYLTGNRITELDRGAFHMVPQLRILDLNKNRLRRVHPESFLQHSGSGLEELYLVENDISHVEELRSLLDSLPRLVFLDMRFNNLETIPFGALRGHPTLEYLNLDYNKLHLIDREAFMAMPALRELRLRNNSLSDTLETPFWNLPELKGLDLSGNYFKVLRPSFFANLPSLRRVDLSNNGLSIIDPELFLPTPSLEHVNISYNYIMAIHPATFGQLLSLYELDVSHNRLMEFVPGLPRDTECLYLQHNKIGVLPTASSEDLDLPTLRVLDLSSNKLQTIPKASLRGMPKLKRLYIGKNLLQGITENSLVGLSQLEILQLQGNVIGHIHPNAFREITALKEIDLGNNRLDILVPDLFKDTLLLKRINLSKNQLAEILPGTLDKNLELQNIDVSYNILVHLPITLYGLKNLRYLDMTSNRIKNIDPEIIGSLVNLRELRFTKNYIKELKQGSFNNLQHLMTLYLDQNEIEFVEQNAVRDLPVLKYLKLNKNMLKEIPNIAFNNLPSLQVVELQDNELRSIAPSAFILVPQVLMLNLSNNHLVDLEEAGLNGLKSLEVLDVSNNKVIRVASPTLEKMEWLVELRMDSNEICGIQGTSFDAMPRLRVLSLRNNKMTSFPEPAMQKLRGNIAVLDMEGNPLICGCNIMWLQAWLHESSQIGPHCMDGNLVREIKLSREECARKSGTAEMTSPGCDAELLTGASPYTTSQVFSQWMKLKAFKNETKNSANHKNNIAPSPEESEYFYDEYIDYPYNESVVEAGGFLNGQANNGAKPTTVKGPVATKSPHYTSGDTPTIYAASNNTKKTSIPPKVSNSPSTSGFTFFGVPLPNLNLNNLLGRGTGRRESKPPSTTATAERKTAVVNKVSIGTGRSSIGNIPSNLPLKMPEPYMQPPTTPEIQTGFLPVLPGSYGGFKPIPNPSLTMRQPPAANNNLLSTVTPENDFFEDRDQNNQAVGVVRSKQSVVAPAVMKIPVNIPSTAAPLITNRLLNKTEVFTNANSANRSVSSEIDNQSEVATVVVDSTSESITESSVEIAQVEVQELTTTIEEETTVVPDIETSTSTEKVNTKPTEKTSTTESVLIITTEEPEIITTSNPRYTATVEIVKNISSEKFKSVHFDKRYEEFVIEKNSNTPSSSLLATGGNQFKNGGRSTITKIPSPHSGKNPVIQSSLEKTNVPNPLPHRDSKNTYEYFSNPTTAKTTKDDTNWYFANYNRTNLEPYVARITNINRAGRFHGFWCLQLVLLAFYIRFI